MTEQDFNNFTKEYIKEHSNNKFVNSLLAKQKPLVSEQKAIDAIKNVEDINSLKNSDAKMTREERKVFTTTKALLTNLPKWKGPEIKSEYDSSLNALIKANDFYAKYPELKIMGRRSQSYFSRSANKTNS